MRVLVIGWEVSDFMCPVFDRVRKENGITVDLFELRPQDQIKKAAYSAFNNVLDLSLKITDYSKAELYAAAKSDYFFKKLLSGNSVKDALRAAVLYRKFKPVISSYDVVHICFITSTVFSFFDAIKSAKRLVITWWGSDLMHNNHDYNYSSQALLVDIADRVTVHQREMKEVFLAKFGRDKLNKVQELLFASDTAYMQKYVDAIPLKENYINSFKLRHNIPAHKRIVVVGHTAHTTDNHLPVLASIAPYSKEVANDVCFVFPMTYGVDDEGHFDAVQKACDDMGAQCVILKEFLTNEEMFELRMASELLLRLSNFDAFSLSLCETLAAGNMVVTGTWLPYGKLRGNGVYFEEVYEIQGVGKRFIDIIRNFDGYMQRCKPNPDELMAVFHGENAAQKLYNIYRHE